MKNVCQNTVITSSYKQDSVNIKQQHFLHITRHQLLQNVQTAHEPLRIIVV